MRRSRFAGFVVAAAAVLSWGPRAELRADDDEFEALSSPDAEPAAVADGLAELARSHASGAFAAHVGRVTVISPDTDSGRAADAARTVALMRSVADLLRTLGFDAPADPPALTVVHVRAKGGRPFVVRASGDRFVFGVRDVDGLRASDAPGPPSRSDGPPLLRDAVESSRRGRLWIDAAENSVGARLGGPGSAAYEFARQVVEASMPKDGAPRWFVDGLAAWAEQQVAKPAASHVCRPFAASKPDALARLLDDDAPRTPVATRFLGRAVGALVAGRTDVPKALDAMRAAGGLPDAALQSAFGVAPAELLAKACQGLKPSECACDDNLTIACPVCKGLGKLTLDCPDCEGSGANVCPSCRGSVYCPTPCWGGVFLIGISEVKCKVCDGKGKTRCAACNGSQRTTCKSCLGRKTSSYPCLVCRAGRLPCPDAGVPAPDVAPGTECPWCRDPARKFCCVGCGGAGYLGCDACHGTLRFPCSTCNGAGEVARLLNLPSFGEIVTGTTCGACSGKGWAKCTFCQSGKRKCAACGGKGLRTGRPEDCPACVSGVLPTRAQLPRTKPLLSAPLDAAEAEATSAMVKRAVEFLLTCREGDSFCLRDLREEGQVKAGGLRGPSLFANAQTLWVLTVAGIDRGDRRVARAWMQLESQANELLRGRADEQIIQWPALALRALVLAGSDPKGPLVSGLVDRIVKSQHPSGWWGRYCETKGRDDGFESLFAVESLRMARLKGAKVPKTVWDKALRAASSSFDSKGPKASRSEMVYATEVLSNLAIVVMAKEGALGAKATAFDYQTMPAVKAGLSWLDRSFDIRAEPQFVGGARVKSVSDSGHAAYVFAVQRLAMLLNMEVLADDRWHAAGARHLKPLQYPDGGFEERAPGHLNGPVRTTECYLLFLLRATAPITDVKDD